ncbi:MAG: O-antigen ligase family protein [Bacteroidales bacterium]|nr:O-antigen ligase family protein [Bacteroidales bacterium]
MMTSKASIRPYLNQAYLLGLLMVAVGLTLSPFLMGMSQFWLVIVWFVDALTPPFKGGGGIKTKISRFFHNKAAVLMVAFYLMHVVGLLWTSDFQYALKDLRVKLPILVMPFVLSSMEPLDRKRFNIVVLIYVLSVFIATQFSFIRYVQHNYEDVREISHFISHIRFCLNIVFCIAIIGWYLYHRGVSTPSTNSGTAGSTTLGKQAPELVEGPSSKAIIERPSQVKYPVPAFGVKRAIDRFLQWFLLLWFIYQIYIFESLSGYVILAAVVIASAVYAFLQWKKGRGWRIAIGLFAVGAIAALVVVVMSVVKPLIEVKPVDFSTLEKKTAQGNYYWHDTICFPVEDGKYVGLYFNRNELREAWSMRSDMPLEGTTASGENLETTLARYLTSKDLRKDAEGVMALTDEDIRNIEQGVANYNNWKHPGIHARLSSTLFEYNLYRRFNNPNGGSLAQRIEFTRASLHIIKQYPWFGVGTGDVPQAFAQTYDEIHSPLKEEFRFRAHNQYLAIAVAFGIVGLVFFLFVLLYPWLSSKRNHTYLFMVFLTIMLLSMFPEDTLETQAGATLFAFFVSLLLFASPVSRQK